MPSARCFDGRIAYIYPYLDNETRTAKARIELANPGLELKPDMYANVSIATEAIDRALAIPTDAILQSGKGQTVFVARGEGKFEPRPVEKRGDATITAISRSSPASGRARRWWSRAQFMLDSESNLREAVQKMMAPPAEAGGGTDRKAEAGQGKSATSKLPAQKDGAEDLDDLFK